ncbi:MAG TPA: chromate transporter [Lachnospiraceae bacterium]|uniref:chromate transporter n=1 Tax=Anaerosporobacter sp. TaxID=1872529 RepID=UPI000ED301EA|nr:chromate transporter [Anaerosporobacter sp.]HAB61049.1 chromate transporter [Lachnospiraceae bacterium]
MKNESLISEEILEINNYNKTEHVLWDLFRTMFMLSACTFGGGFVIVSLMKKKFVEELGWLEEDEMLDITAMAQSCPGPLPINASVILGYRMKGILGSLVAVIGTSLPPLIIITAISYFYEEFRSNRVIATALQVMRAGVAAVIFDVVYNLASNIIKTKNRFYILLMIVTFIMNYFLGFSAMLIILTCLFLGICTVLLDLRKEHKARC